MKYYSEETKKMYDSEEDLFKAEEALKAEKEEHKKKLAEQVKRKTEVDAAYENYKNLINAYIKDYGTYAYVSTDAGKDTEGSFIDGKFINFLNPYACKDTGASFIDGQLCNLWDFFN